MTTDSVEQERTAAVPEAVSALRRAGKPIVLDYKPKKKNQKRYSKGLADVQRVEGRLSRVNKRVAEAVAKGASTYEKERKKSAGKKKDGSIRDFVPNVGEAVSASLREVSSVPADIAAAVNTKSSRRLLRNQVRLTADMLRVRR
jgi:deoxycytidine triphosphate deaminase